MKRALYLLASPLIFLGNVAAAVGDAVRDFPSEFGKAWRGLKPCVCGQPIMMHTREGGRRCPPKGGFTPNTATDAENSRIMKLAVEAMERRKKLTPNGCKN